MACLSARYSAMACWPSRNRSSFFCKAVEPRSEVSGEFVLNVVTPFRRGPGNARQSLVYLGQIVEALIMRHNALQGPIASISVGLAAMEARHRPCGDGKVVDDRDDDNAPGVLAIRAGAKFSDNQALDIVLGLRKFFHDRTMTDLGSRTDRRLPRVCGVTDRKTQWEIRTRRRGHCGRRALCEDAGGGAIERPIADPGSPWGGRRTSSLTGEW